ATSPLSPPLTILVPAHNEEETISFSLRALLACRYPHLQIIAINDGSADRTLEVLREEFNLVGVRRVPRSTLTTARIRGLFVRVVNGSLVRDGRVAHVHTPTNVLANLQILEYLRAFLGARVAWSRLGIVLIISGAFGLFRRDVVIEAGGYDTNTVGEDAELIL